MTNKWPPNARTQMGPALSPQTGYGASLPGNISASALVWLRCFPQAYIPNLLLAVVFAIIPFVIFLYPPSRMQGVYIVCGIWGALNLLSPLGKFSATRRCCRNGSLCPAVVVSVNPPLIAVSTDLSKSAEESWPALKILRQPLRAVSGPPLQIGDRLPAVSFYLSRSAMATSASRATGLNLGASDKPYWYDFSPVAVPCITDDPAVIQKAMQRLTESGDLWAELQAGLAQVPQPYRVGLYRLNRETGA